MTLNAFHLLKQKVVAESTREYRARGIKVKRCLQCQIMPEHCICVERPALPSDIDFILIYHLDEIFKPTNTGRLIADSFPHNTYAFCYDRLEPPAELLALINDPARECVIVFPATDAQQRNTVSQITPSANKKLTLILLDGTWRQGRRMFNFSLWLKHCLVLKLDPQDKAIYATRKAAFDSYLSTAESAALALASCGQTKNADALFDYFSLFNLRYQKIRGKR